MMYRGKELNLNEYLIAKESVYDNNDGPWKESENYIWAIQEYISSCGYSGEVIKWLRNHDFSVGDFEDDISVEEIAEYFIDDYNITDAELDYIIKWLYEYMTANDMSLCELDEMCCAEPQKVLNAIFGEEK